MKKFNVAVIGVGAVGKEMLRILLQRKFPIANLKVLARSSRVMELDANKYQVEKITPEAFEGVNIALFAGTEGEKGAAVTYAPEAVRRGAVVIDNGIDFRLKPEVPLVVPEINPDDVKNHKGIIANPNCTTIQLTMALWPIHKKAGITRIIVSTYQAASGAGKKAEDELFGQTRALLEDRQYLPSVLPARIAFNVFPQIGGFGELDYTSEEWKVVHETHKIFHDECIKITSTCARVPVAVGHSESVYIETKEPISPKEVRSILEKSDGIEVIDAPNVGEYPLAYEAAGKDEVFVGRIRKDAAMENGLWLWVVADNLRKGAALNAVQIAEVLIHA